MLPCCSLHKQWTDREGEMNIAKLLLLSAQSANAGLWE